MDGVSTGYVPGACNIGGAEVSRRRIVGWLGLAATAGLAAALWATGAPVICRAALFLPAAVSASGFLQARAGFCVGYGLRSGFNFSDRIGQFEVVPDAASRSADTRRSFRMLGAIAAVGTATVVVALLLP